MGPLEDLKQRIEDERVLVIAGAGVGIATNPKAPTWKGLLQHGVEYCRAYSNQVDDVWAAAQQAALERSHLFEWLGVASQIEQLLGASRDKDRVRGEYRAWLESACGELAPENPEVAEALAALSAPIATTNYDGLIESVTARQPVAWCDAARVQQVLQGHDRDAVIHLHGFWRRPETAILGYQSYTDLIGHAAAQAMQQSMRTMFSLLFVGCGDTVGDPNFDRWLGWARETFRGTEIFDHYILVLDRDVDDLAKRLDPDDRLRVLGYGARYDDLAGFLRSLKKRIEVTAPPGPEAEPAVRPIQTATVLPGIGHLVGRSSMLREMVGHVTSPSPRPLPVLGGPGMGKSAVTIAALHDDGVEVTFGARRFFVRCDGVATAEALPGAIAAAMGLGNQAADPSPVVYAALSAAPALLVLDNLETPWDADPAATEHYLGTLAAIDSVVLVASLRSAIAPLGVPWRKPIRVGRLATSEAREAFLRIAGQSFADDDHLDEVLSLCEGVPLALTLMARATAGQPRLSWLLDAWREQRTAIFNQGDDPLHDLDLSVAMSVDGPRMNDDARTVLSALALLPAGVALDDLPVLFPAKGRKAAQALAAVGLGFFEDERLRLLAPVRESTVRHRPASDAQKARLVEHYLGLVTELGDRIGRSDGADALDRLVPEVPNVDATVDLALAAGPKPALDAVYGLGEVYRFSGLGALDTLERVANAAQEPIDVGRCHEALGLVSMHRADLPRAKKHFERAVAMYQAPELALGLANCILFLGEIARRTSKFHQARQHYEEAIGLYRAMPEVEGEANCLWGLGELSLKAGDPDAARQHIDAGLTIFRSIKEPLGEANCMVTLGEIAQATGTAGADASFERALALYLRAGDLAGVSSARNGLGALALAAGDLDRAQNEINEALMVATQVGSLEGRGRILLTQADLMLARDAPTRAATHAREALAAFERLGDPYWSAKAHQTLAQTTSGRARDEHLATARGQWTGIGRDDLAAGL